MFKSICAYALKHVSNPFSRQGFLSDRRITNIIAQYLPTVLVILLSFTWHMLVTDLKKVTPWAVMTNKWSEPGESILANYIDDLEIISVWNSFRRKNWGILMALLGGFICGSLVPFAGSLFYFDDVHELIYNSTLIRTSRFEFNGSLDAFDPSNPIAQQRVAILSRVEVSDSSLPHWTSQENTFESFNLSGIHHNAALSVNSAAFDGTLDCGTINYNTEVSRDWYTEEYAYGDPRYRTPGLLTDVELIPNEEDMLKIGCNILPAFYPIVIFSRPSDQSIRVLSAAWMNVTKCSSTGDTPLTITTMILLNDKANDTMIRFNVTGVLCRPRFSIRTLNIVVNASTAELMEITPLSNTSIPVEIGIDSTTLISAITGNGPTSEELMNYNALVPQDDNYWLDLKRAEEGEAYHPHAGFIGRDPWFMKLSSANASKIEKYTTDTKALAIDSSQLFQRTMAQIANLAFRTNDSSPVPGFLKTREPRLTIRRSSLFYLQSTLGLLGITAICCATVIRPKSCLKEDPATLAALSIIVASSEDFQRRIKSKGHLDDKSCRKRLQGLKVRYKTDESLTSLIETRSSIVSVTMYLTGIVRALLSFKQAWTPLSDSDTHNNGYMPLMLRIAPRTCLMVTITGTMVALGTLLRDSNNQSGFDAQTTLKNLGWTYTPSAILVLLGYAVEGASSCTQAVSSYMTLSRGSVSGRKSLLFNVADHSAFAMFSYGYWQNIRWTFFTSSMIVIIYPAIKVIAAGLYIHSLGRHMFTATIEIDQSLMANLYKVSITGVLRQQLDALANEYAIWTLTPQMDFPSPSGSAGSLIFSNLTSNSLSSEASQALCHGALLTATVPAIQVEVNCSAYTSEDFQVVRVGSIVRILCKSQGCQKYFQQVDDPNGLPADIPIWRGGFNISARPNLSYYGYTRNFDGLGSDPEMYRLATISGIFMQIGDYGPNVTSAIQRFIMTPKAIAGYSCVRAFNKVNVNVTFARAIQANLREASLLSTNIAGFDSQSILPANDLPTYSNNSVTMSYPQHCTFSPNLTCGAFTSSILPSAWSWGANDSPNTLLADDESTGFLGLLAATQLQYQASNTSALERLFEPEHLQEAAKEAYTIFSAQAINQLRNLTSRIGNSTVRRTATINQQSLRAVQSRDATVVLIVLLGIILGCIVLAVWRVPLKPVIAKAPNSIAAQASLLAGSSLVRRLREEGVKSVAETNIWNEEVFSMGWWVSDEPQPEGGVREERWGIDIGVARLRNTLEK